MRAALSKCASSHIVLFDFLAPRLLTTANSRSFIRAAPGHLLTSTSRHSSVSATARIHTTKSSVLDVAENPAHDLSHYAAQMRSCASEADILGVWNAYQQIQQRNARIVLGPQQYGATSLMLVKLFANAHSGKKWTEQEMHALEELAFVCSSAGYVEGFRQMLTWRLVKRDVEKLITLYDRFDQTVVDLDKTGLQRATSGLSREVNVDGAVPLDPPLENPDISGQDITNVMALAIAAHAVRDSFPDALQVILRRSSHRIGRDDLRNLELELQTCGDADATNVVAKTRSFYEAASAARLVQQPEAFKAHIRNLLKEKNPVPRLDKVTQSLLNGFSGSLAWAAKDNSKQSPARPVVVVEKIWAYLVRAYIVSRKEDTAEKLWAKLLNMRITPSADMWNSLLEGYRETHQVQKLLNAWEMMRQEGVRFDARSYGSKISCLYAARLKNYASKAFEEFKEAKLSQEDSLFVYNTVLSGHLGKDDLSGAVTLFEEMKRQGPKPDIVSYNTFISYHGKKGNMRGVANIVKQLTRDQVQPDVFTFTTLLTAMLKARVPNGVEQLLTIMESMGVKQNVATYSAIIDAQVRDGTQAGIRTAWEMLQRMERMKDIKPNVITYTSVLAGVHRSKDLDKELVASISSDIVQRMERRGVWIKRGTYHILLKACLENPNPESLDFFLDYYNSMERKGIPFWHDTWYIILNGLIRRDAWALASEMKDRMLESDFRPMWGVSDMMKSIQVWELNNRSRYSI